MKEDPCAGFSIFFISYNYGTDECFYTEITYDKKIIHEMHMVHAMINTTYELSFDYHSSAEVSYSFPMAYFSFIDVAPPHLL